ncbi:MAG: PH domain-containing protein [Clostridiaceae bacterium]|nr:PH domain-containing protein [Clostridiaceae bacterium]
MKYNSKKDWWIGAIIWIPMLFGLYRMGYVSFVEDQSVLFFIIFAIFIGFVSWIWFGTYYVFDDEYLIVRCGPIKEIVLYKDIVSVKKTRNPLSSAALSIDRIEIMYGKRTLISPAKEQDFLTELKKG